MGRAERRREGDVLPGWPRSTPGSPSTPTPRSAGSSTTSRSPGQLDNTIIFYCADNGASGEGSPNGSVNEGKIFGGYPDDARGEPGHGRPARHARHLQPLPDRMGGGVLHPVPDVQALHLPGRGLRPAGHPLAGRASRPRARCATSTTTRTDIVADDPTTCAASSSPTTYDGVAAEPAVGGVDAVQLRSPTPDGADRRSRRSTTRCSAAAASGTTAGRRSPMHGPMGGIGELRRRQLAAVPHRRGPLRGRTTSPTEHPDKVEELEGAVDGARPRRTTCCR